MFLRISSSEFSPSLLQNRNQNNRLAYAKHNGKSIIKLVYIILQLATHVRYAKCEYAPKRAPKSALFVFVSCFCHFLQCFFIFCVVELIVVDILIVLEAFLKLSNLWLSLGIFLIKFFFLQKYKSFFGQRIYPFYYLQFVTNSGLKLLNA